MTFRPLNAAVLLFLAGCGDPSLDEPEPTDTVASAASPAARGFNAQYFEGRNEFDRLVLNRVDATIDFDWGTASPDVAVPNDNFTVRWVGLLSAPTTGDYTFELTADDGSRLTVNGQPVIDRWNNVWASSRGTVRLTAGVPAKLEVEMFEAWGSARAKLTWQGPGVPKQVVPASRVTPTPMPPSAPTSGPGSTVYPHGSCVTTAFTPSTRERDYWVFEPSAPTLSAAPLVVFNHGWLGIDPWYYQDWLEHLCRKGNIVVFPRYQQYLTAGGRFAPNAIWSVQDALRQLGNRVDRARGMVLVGHSAGGTVSMVMADRAARDGLPTPRAILAAEPGGEPGMLTGSVTAQYAGIPSSTYVSCVVGDEDTVVGRDGCDNVFSRIAHVPASRRDYVWMFSDAHGDGPLVADHFAPSGGNRTRHDALDTFGFWRLADALRDCAFFGTSCGLAAGGGAAHVSMGQWSDGVAVRPLAVSDDPPPCPANSGALGCTP